VREAAELPFVRVFVLGVSGLRGGAAGYELEEMVSSWLADGGDRAVQSHGRRARAVQSHGRRAFLRVAGGHPVLSRTSRIELAVPEPSHPARATHQPSRPDFCTFVPVSWRGTCRLVRAHHSTPLW